MTALAAPPGTAAPTTAALMTVNTPMPAWYDWLADDGEAAEGAVVGIVELATGRDVLAVELHDTTRTLDGLVWTWLVHLAPPRPEAAETAHG